MYWYRTGAPPAPFTAAGRAYVFIYGMLTLAFLVLMMFRGHNFHICGLGGAQRLQQKMLHK